MPKINKIKMIYTGGTIGMQLSSRGLIPSEKIIHQFLVENELEAKIDLCLAEPLIDSSSLELEHWNQWLLQINQSLSNYCGVIVLHGTDTLAYTASMLAVLYAEVKIPIIITGAMLPLFNQNSDGNLNILSSIQAIESLNYGVFVVFNQKILTAIDCVKVNAISKNAFISPHVESLGVYDIVRGWSFSSYIEQAPIKISVIDPNNFQFKSDIKIANFFLRPNMTHDMLRIMTSLEWDVIIFQAFGNGNFNIEPALKKHINEQLQRKKLILNVSQVLTAGVDRTYASAYEILELGVISGLSLTFELCYSLTVIALSHFSEYVQQVAWLTQLIENIDKKISILATIHE